MNTRQVILPTKFLLREKSNKRIQTNLKCKIDGFSYNDINFFIELNGFVFAITSTIFISSELKVVKVVK